ncbi:MAG: SDR family NAD(P)-dependent oxidoreductase [Cellvibrionales bacterium]|nr:SDR family NAD(P)-dependent oxidoreductase [Cellvibrionales bacterium]
MIVTGCAPGSIGFETARTLADWGATVIVTTRSTVEKTVQALRAVTTGGAVDGHTLDLASADSVAAFVAWFEKKYAGQLDILVNNAGIHLDLLSQWKPRS